jgi:hypothetical protein
MYLKVNLQVNFLVSYCQSLTDIPASFLLYTGLNHRRLTICMGWAQHPKHQNKCYRKITASNKARLLQSRVPLVQFNQSN